MLITLSRRAARILRHDGRDDAAVRFPCRLPEVDQAVKVRGVRRRDVGLKIEYIGGDRFRTHRKGHA